MRQSSGIGVLDKSVAVLAAVAESPCALADLCDRTGLPRATAHRLAVGLEVHQYLTRDAGGRWAIGPAIASLAAHAVDTLAQAAEPVLARLRDATGETVQLYRRDGTERVCVATAEPVTGLRDTVPVGTTLPMTRGSGARVLAAWADADALRAILADDAAFDEGDLARTREDGWAHTVAERATGVASVSVPVREPAGRVVAAISVSGPVDRIARRSTARWVDDLAAAARAITERL